MSEAVARAARALSRDGFCLCRGGVDASVVAEARREAGALFRHGLMSPGGFTIRGRDDAVQSKRDDQTLWLHEYLNTVGGPERGGAGTLCALDGVLSRFGEAVVRELTRLSRTEEPMGRADDGGPLHYTGRTDLMLACYPGGGAAYGPHIDNVDGDGRDALDYGRCFTCVYYLNEAPWDDAARGGALRVHLAPPDRPNDRRAAFGLARSDHDAVDISPRGDSLVIFRADRVLHEVRPSHAPRYAATMWLYAGSREAAERANGS